MVKVEFEVDPTVRRPVALMRSQPAPASPVALDISHVYAPPLLSVRLPTVIMPGEFPGLIFPPELTVVAPPVPLPANVPPLLIEMALAELVPLSTKVPALIVVAPV